jgi:anti-anti-sigma regulatory factor
MGGRPRDGEPAGPRVASNLMPAPDFALALERLGNGTTVLVIEGELDLYRVPEIEHALAQAIEPQRAGDRRERTCGAGSAERRQRGGGQAARLTVDLRSTTFLDSTTLEVLLAASRRQRARGGELVVLVGPQTPTTAFEVTGFDRLLAIKHVDTGPSATVV